MMKHKWFVKDGHIFSEEVKIKKNNDFRFSENFEYQPAVAFNVGQKLAEHIVNLHNQSLDHLCGK